MLSWYYIFIGETTNKIGTYNLALSAFHHHIPFYVVSPLTLVDLSISSSEYIIIEESSPKELTRALCGQGQQVAPFGISIWNPTFDITLTNLISMIITEKVHCHIYSFVNKLSFQKKLQFDLKLGFLHFIHCTSATMIYILVYNI